MNDCMWTVPPLKFRFDESGRVVEAWLQYTNAENEYCGREIVWMASWK